MSHHQLDTPEGRRLLRALRDVCDDLPEVGEEINGFGHTTLRVGYRLAAPKRLADAVAPDVAEGPSGAG